MAKFIVGSFGLYFILPVEGSVLDHYYEIRYTVPTLGSEQADDSNNLRCKQILVNCLSAIPDLSLKKRRLNISSLLFTFFAPWIVI
jgi:hypothetical protein